MGFSVRMGTLFGIPVYLHWTFLLLLGFVLLSEAFVSGSFAAALGGLVFVCSIFACVVLHELGHALAARRYGIETRDVILLPIGGVARLERMPEIPRHELVVALAGPAVNVVLAGLLGLWLLLRGIGAGDGLSLTDGSLAARLLSVNLTLVAFNMLPAFPMDGGRVLRALLAERTSYLEATELAATVGRGMAVLFGIGGLFWNPMLLFIAVFVWIGAGQEAEMVRRREAFGRWPQWLGFQPARRESAPVRPVPWVVRRERRPVPQRRIYRVGPWLVYRDEG